MWNFRRKLFWENFSEIWCKPRLSSAKNCEILPYFSAILSWVRIPLKKYEKFKQVLSYVVCTQL